MKSILFVSAIIVLSSSLFAAETPLVVDKEKSHVEAAVKSTMDNFTAKLTAFDALVSVDAAQKRVASAQFKFRFTDIKTSNEKRDTDMHKWQQTDQFPECVYILDALLPASGGTFNARGKFTLHGITRELIFPVTVGFTGTNVCTIDGDLPLDTRDYGLPIKRSFAVLKVDPVLQVKFHLEGHSPPGS
jgi:polyisoprenoid-binding protein YceI